VLRSTSSFVIVKMAKKKTKKNNQKQVETQPQPDSLHTATTVTTEVPTESATSEIQQHSITPPSKTTNDEGSVGGSVAVLHQTHEAIQDQPGEEEEPSRVTDYSNDGSTTKSIEHGDKDVTTTVPIDEPAASTIDGSDHVATENKEIQLSVKESAEPPQSVHSNAAAVVPESVVPDVMHPTQSDAYTTGSQAEAEMEPPTVPLPTSVADDIDAPGGIDVANQSATETAGVVESQNPPPTESVATQSEELAP
jgi:hypothetical protein